QPCWGESPSAKARPWAATSGSRRALRPTATSLRRETATIEESGKLCRKSGSILPLFRDRAQDASGACNGAAKGGPSGSVAGAADLAADAVAPTRIGLWIGAEKKRLNSLASSFSTRISSALILRTKASSDQSP